MEVKHSDAVAEGVTAGARNTLGRVLGVLIKLLRVPVLLAEGLLLPVRDTERHWVVDFVLVAGRSVASVLETVTDCVMEALTVMTVRVMVADLQNEPAGDLDRGRDTDTVPVRCPVMTVLDTVLVTDCVCVTETVRCPVMTVLDTVLVTDRVRVTETVADQLLRDKSGGGKKATRKRRKKNFAPHMPG